MFCPKQIEAKRLHDISDDVLEIIFEELKISDLFRVIESNDAFRQPAIWAFRHNHVDFIKINSGNFHKTSNFGNEKGVIDIESYEMSLKLFAIFGDSIKRLHINYVHMNRSQINEINRLICDRCAVRLTHFEMVFNSVKFHDDLIPSIFPEVEVVSFLVGDLVGTSDIDLNEKFPKMRSLRLAHIIMSSSEWIECNFPHLMEFSIYFPSMGKITETQIERMLRANPQIRTVIVGMCSANFMRILNDNLPHIESLELLDLPYSFFGDANPVIEFQNVKKFTLDFLFHVRSMDVYIPFVFGHQLEEIKLIWTCSKLGKQWFRMIESYPNIKKLHFQFRKKTCDTFAYLTNMDMPNLRECRMQGINFNENGEFQRFFDGMQQWTTLQKLQLVDIPFNQTALLRDVINFEWRMTVFDNQYSDEFVDVIIAKA